MIHGTGTRMNQGNSRINLDIGTISVSILQQFDEAVDILLIIITF